MSLGINQDLNGSIASREERDIPWVTVIILFLWNVIQLLTVELVAGSVESLYHFSSWAELAPTASIEPLSMYVYPEGKVAHSTDQTIVASLPFACCIRMKLI